MRTHVTFPSLRTLTSLAIVVTLAAICPQNTYAQCESAKLLASDGVEFDELGWSVDVSGDTMVVTTRTEYWPDPAAAYVFTRDGETWVEQTKLQPTDITMSDDLGLYGAVFGDTIVVGGWVNDTYPSGVAIVYRYNGADWIEEARLTPFGAPTGDNFGTAVAIDGDLAIIGGSEAVYVYRYNGADWIEEQKLLPSDPENCQRFGICVDVANDTIVVGTHPEQPATGSAYTFEYDAGAWSETQKLVAPNGAAQDKYGLAVAISGDALAVGASELIDEEWVSSVFVYRQGGADWIQQQQLQPSDPNVLSISGFLDIDDNIIVVSGSRQSDAGPSGTALVFQFDGVWSELAELDPSDGDEWFSYGWSVAISGETVVVGEPGDCELGYYAGAAHVYKLNGEDCNLNGVCDFRDIAEGTSWDDNDNGVPWECDCPGDLNFDRYVDLIDLSILLAHFLDSDAVYTDGDINFDGVVDLADLAALLAVFGAYCPPGI